MTVGVLTRLLRPFTPVFCAVLFTVAFPIGVARAETIVYTGQGPFDNGLSLSKNQWLAGEFTVTDVYNVTSIEGWIFTSRSGVFRVTLYGDGGAIPGAALFSTTVQPSFGLAWTGATNLSWLITPGSYWAAFEVPGDSLYAGSMPFPAPNPLEAEAFAPAPFPYRPSASHLRGIGLRVMADPVGDPVPEPGTLFLVTTGIAAAGMRRWRHRRSAEAPSPR